MAVDVINFHIVTQPDPADVACPIVTPQAGGYCCGAPPGEHGVETGTEHQFFGWRLQYPQQQTAAAIS